MHLSMQNKTRIAFALVGFLILFTIITTEGREEGLRFKVKGDTAYVDGGTDSFSYGSFKNFIDEYPDVEHLVLRRMPGTTDSTTNLRIARLIRRRNITTHLERRSIIASGAVDLFISGRQRTMECGALIGVHSWSFDGHVGPKDIGRDDNQKMHETFLKDMGVDPDFYVFTREAADPDEIYYLKSDEIDQYGLLTEPVDCS